MGRSFIPLKWGWVARLTCLVILMKILSRVGNIANVDSFQRFGFEFCRMPPRRSDLDLATKSREPREIIFSPLYLYGIIQNNRKRKFGHSNVLNASNTKHNSILLNERAYSMEYFLNVSPPYGLPVCLVECLCSVSRHVCAGWSTLRVANNAASSWSLFFLTSLISCATTRHWIDWLHNTLTSSHGMLARLSHGRNSWFRRATFWGLRKDVCRTNGCGFVDS